MAQGGVNHDQNAGKRMGRPKSVSPQLIQEAALELFQLNGYEATSVDEIARVAGFSRATFFNYFRSKAEIFWLETDQLLDHLEAILTEKQQSDPSPQQLRALLIHLASDISSEQIPWIFGNSEIISSREDLLAAGFSRILRLSDLIQHYFSSESTKVATNRLESYQIVANILAALEQWIADGVNRAPLSSYLATTLSTPPVD